MMKLLPTSLVILCALISFSSCKKRDTVADRAAEAAAQAKAQTDPSAHAAIDEAQRIATETNQPVQVRVTERVEIDPQVPPPPAYAPPPPAVIVAPPPVGGIPPAPIVEIEEPRRSPGQVLDNALRKVGEGLQKAGERIEERAAEAQR